jgi:hypothetical protein
MAKCPSCEPWKGLHDGHFSLLDRDGAAGSLCTAQQFGLAAAHGVSVCGGVVSARDIADLARDSEPVMQQLLRYTQALFAHMAQTSACNRHHALDTQLCRWLLQHLDRQSGDALQITQARIAGMLGVRREGITGAALRLQCAGLISYGRGRIQVLNRRGLEDCSCKCCGVVAAVTPCAAEFKGSCGAPWLQGLSPQRDCC